jgi:hypothetical protein
MLTSLALAKKATEVVKPAEPAEPAESPARAA